MSKLIRLGWLLLLSIASSCAGMKWYTLPVTPYEGEQLIPALIATSQEMGFQSFRGNNAAVTKLADGTTISWQDSADHRSFILLLDLPGDVVEAERENRWVAAKQQAERIWEAALATRQHINGALAPVVIQQNVGGVNVNVSNRPPVPASNSQPACKSGVDCGPAELCKNRGDGYLVCMGKGAPGDFCASGVDCGTELFCRPTGTVNTCQQ